MTSDIWTWRATGLLLGAMGLAHAMVLLLRPQSRTLEGLNDASGLIVFLVLLAAAGLTYAHWRLSGSQIAAWLTVGLLAFATPNLALAALSAAGRPHQEPAWQLLAILLATLSLLVVATLAARVEPDRDPVAPGLLLGVTVSVVALMSAGTGLGPLPAAATVGLIAAPLLVAVGLAVLLLRATGLPVWARLRFAAAALLLTGAQVVAYAPGSGGDLLLVTRLVGLLSGVVLAGGTCLALVRLSLLDHGRTLESLGDRLARAEARVREDRARLHEIGATVAGIASANRLIRDDPVLLPIQRRSVLEDMMGSEVARLERLLRKEVSGLRDFCLDDVLRPVVVAQQAQGHQVTWKSTGHRATGSPDELAEVLTVLLNNAAEHGGNVGSTLEVQGLDGVVEILVSDAGPGVPPDVRCKLFDWGARGPGSTGQGIGLHIARELAEKNSGYLLLEDAPGPGTTFVVGLRAGVRHDAIGHRAR